MGVDSFYFGKRSLTPPHFHFRPYKQYLIWKLTYLAKIWYPIEVAEVQMTIYDFLGSKITKSIFFNFFITKSCNFISNLNEDCSQLSVEVYYVFVAPKLKTLAFYDRFFYTWTLATLATSRGPNLNLSNLNRVFRSRSKQCARFSWGKFYHCPWRFFTPNF